MAEKISDLIHDLAVAKSVVDAVFTDENEKLAALPVVIQEILDHEYKYDLEPEPRMVDGTARVPKAWGRRTLPKRYITHRDYTLSA